MAKPIKYLDYEGLKALYGVVDGKITSAVSGAKTELLGDAAEGYNTLGKLEDKIQAEETRATGAEKALDDAIKAMVLNDTAASGQFITAVHQTDGKVTVDRGGVSASMVTATNVEEGAGTVAITGATVEEQIKSLGQTLKTVEGNAAKYKVVKLSPTEVEGLSDGANVREAYKVVSYVGADPGSDGYTQVGEIIKIYKDAALLSVTPENGVAGENTVIKFTYSLADGTQKDVSVDLGKAIFESEMGNGMQVVDHKIAIKLDTANDGDFLTVGADGLKLSGVKEAIKTAVDTKNVTAQGDDYITASATGNKVNVSADIQPLTVDKSGDADSTIAGVEKSLVDGKEVADKVTSFTNARISEEIAKLDATAGGTTVTAGKHVAVQVVESDGKITAVNVNENDIASAATLASVKTAQEKNTAAISGAINEDEQSISLGTKGLQFVALTKQEIQDAANSAAGI